MKKTILFLLLLVPLMLSAQDTLSVPKGVQPPPEGFQGPPEGFHGATEGLQGPPEGSQPRPEWFQPQMNGERQRPMMEDPTSNPYVHDPVMARGEDGKYYLFSTGMGVQVLSSEDMVMWHRERSVFDRPPQWAMNMVRGYRGHTWAPDICRHNGLWYLYYSCSTFGKNESAIGLAVNKTLDPTSPDFGWEDRGLVIASRRHGDCWNAIDPNLAFSQKGKPYLVFGSFWDGIQMVELDAKDLQTPLTEPRTIARRWNHVYTLEEIDNPDLFEIEGTDTIEAADNAVEAPFIAYNKGYYYLFVSQDYCCRGRRSTYRTVYGRSKDIEGPYVDKDGVRMDEGGGTLLFGPDEQYYGIGHSAVYELDGQWWFFCHAYDKDANSRATLFQNPIDFDSDGWIVVNASTSTAAYDFEQDGLYYNITPNVKGKKTVEVTYKSKTSENNYKTELIIIPDSVKYKGKYYYVTAIGDYAFMGCSDLDSIRISKKVTSIGDYAFAWCKNMKKVGLPDGLEKIGTCAFTGCSSLERMVIPHGVDYIGNGAFSECSRLMFVRMPGSVSSIGDYTFGGCSKLVAAIIPESVEEIGMEAFAGCKGLRFVWIPEGVRSIGDFAFSSCAGLKKVKLPSTVSYIGNHAYEKCTRMDTISISSGVSVIGDCVFYGCPRLTYIECLSPQAPTGYGLMFKGFNFYDCLLEVPMEAVNSYKESDDWTDFYYIRGVDYSAKAEEEEDADDSESIMRYIRSWIQ